jgi:peptidyl-prolyl cis-trans isomerase SurA
MRTVAFAIALLSAATLAAQVPLDSVVARADRHPILRSDVEAEAELTRLLAGQSSEITTADETAALARLVDRALIQDQMDALGATRVSEADVKKDVAELRKQIPGAETDAGWQQILARYGLTEDEVERRVSEQVQTLRFVDMRFRSEVHVGPNAIKTYYDSTFVPEMQRKNQTPPPLDQVQDKIESILREQRVNGLIEEWLKSLRGQSRIESFDASFPLAGLEKRTPDVSDLRSLPLRITPSEQKKPQQ